MLKDADFTPIPDHVRQLWKDAGLDDANPYERLEEGVYQGPLNFHNALDREHWIYMWNPWSDRKAGDPEPAFPSYGVHDSIEACMAQFGPALREAPGTYCISFVTMRKDEQPEHGGWRWHKWGHYYGAQNPQYEYLYDEPEIESVVVFEIHKKKDA